MNTTTPAGARPVRIERVSSSSHLRDLLSQGSRVIVYHSSVAPLSLGQVLNADKKLIDLPREQVLEQYRKDQDPYLPSRAGAIFGACTPEDALHFRPGGIVYEIELVLKETSGSENNYAACILDTHSYERVADIFAWGLKGPAMMAGDQVFDLDNDPFLTDCLSRYWDSYSYSRKGFEGVPEILIDPAWVTIRVIRAFSLEALAENIVAMASERKDVRGFMPYEFEQQFNNIKRDFNPARPETEGDLQETEKPGAIYDALNWDAIRTRGLRKIVQDMLPLLDAPISIDDIGFETYSGKPKYRIAETLYQYLGIEGIISDGERALIKSKIEKAENNFRACAHGILLEYMEKNADKLYFERVLTLSGSYEEACKAAGVNLDEGRIKECLRKRAAAEIEGIGTIRERIKSADQYGFSGGVEIMGKLLIAIELSGQSVSMEDRRAIMELLSRFVRFGYGGMDYLLNKAAKLFNVRV